ncbi:substrate-binding domain-containing protein [Micromonospora sp. HK10]|uniref:substrate-binding domain-containing protein n=1 Tax=Micromonospora sp. HK10 TaxID=1538294 RepID=UPI00062701A2|nr:substrate-binding domain-containing protein [Micromonospora sp. HK10]
MKRTRWAAASAAALALASMLTACSSGQADTAAGSGDSKPKSGKIKIAYLQKQGDQQYFVDEGAGAKAKAAELGDVEVSMFDLGTDSDKAINALDQVIAQKFDAIAIVVPDQLIGPQVIDKAKQAGIPLIASDDVIKDAAGAEAPFAGFDGAAMGEKVGTEAGTLFKQSGWSAADTRIISAYKQDLSVCQDRVNAADKAFAAAAGAEVKVIKLGTDNSAVDAQNKTGALVTANAGVKHWIVYGCNDENVSGVVTALANARFGATDVIGVGLGAYLACKDWQAGTATGFKSALFIDGREVGASAVQALVKKVRDGVDLPAKTVANTAIVNKDTWQSAGVKCS